MNNLTGGCERVIEIDNSDMTILPDGLIDRLTNAQEAIVLYYPTKQPLPNMQTEFLKVWNCHKLHFTTLRG